jgi:trimeric autotransporter adhesin
MKNRIYHLFAALAGLALFTLNIQLSVAHGQGTAFTYQGQLQDTGNLANGTYNLQFLLYTNSSGGTPVAGPVIVNTVGISNGLFTVAIDFGSGVWNGQTNWLEIDVEPYGGGSFTTLAPRQQLTPSPYTIYAELAGGLPGLSVQPGADDAPNVIGGSTINYVAVGVEGAAIGGGGTTNYGGASYSNSVTASFGAVGGGFGNMASGELAAVGGGAYNTASGPGAFIGGGGYNGIGFGGNQASGGASFVGSGGNNVASGFHAAVVGGAYNTASGPGAFAGGGGYDGVNYNGNKAYGNASFIGGGLGNYAYYNYSTVGGGYENIASGEGATICGGGYDGQDGYLGNQAAGGGSFVGGGLGNSAGEEYATVGGGVLNRADNMYSTTGGGYQNTNTGYAAVMAGGYQNIASAAYTAVGGGELNNALNNFAIVPGGRQCVAGGLCSFAAGDIATANYNYSFVWGDGSRTFSDTGTNQFDVLATGGANFYTSTAGTSVAMDTNSDLDFGTTVRQMLNLYSLPGNFNNYGIGVQNRTLYYRCGNDVPDTGFAWYQGGSPNVNPFNAGGGQILMTLTNGGLTVNGTVYSYSVALTSDRNAKENFTQINPGTVLDKVAALPIMEWNYKTDKLAEHIGPMAQDFKAAFGLDGPDDKHISVVDEGGVALAAIQGLDRKVEAENTALRAENAELKKQNDSLDERLKQLEQTVRTLAERN